MKVLRKLKRKLKKTSFFPQDFLYIFLGFALLMSITVAAFFAYFSNRIYPNVFIANTNFGGLTKTQALEKIKANNLPDKIVISKNTNDSKNTSFAIILSEINLAYNYNDTIETAFNIGRNKKAFPAVKEIINTLIYSTNVSYKYSYNNEKLNEYLATIASQIFDEPVYPSFKYSNNQVIVEKGKAGTDLDKDAIIAEINNQFSEFIFSDIPLTTKYLSVELSDTEATIAQNRANNILNKKLEFSSSNFQTSSEGKELFELFDPKGGYYNTAITKYANTIKTKIDKKPQNPVFVFEEGRVKEFVPARDGETLDEQALSNKIVTALVNLETLEDKTQKIELPIKTTPPDYQTSDVNNLGIKELIGKGESYFKGSIPSRVHNVTLASSKFNGIIVKPGETLSFNQILGDVSSFTGYQQAYVIRDGKTVLGDGGGVCQVSTTLFRAALNAGLDIAERKAHSYRVGYYEQSSYPGIDATVYYPTSDLKIMNNTNNHILIQTLLDKKLLKLTFEIYGTDDGRIAEITVPKVTGVTPPPEDLYIDDPTLPSGTVKQIDWKAWGAKVTFNYKVTKDGQTLTEKSFFSNYRPWQAKFLRGTAL